MTRKDRTEGIYSRREVLDESERRQFYLIQLKDLLTYAYRYSEDVKKRFDRAQFNVEKFKSLSDPETHPDSQEERTYLPAVHRPASWRPVDQRPWRIEACVPVSWSDL